MTKEQQEKSFDDLMDRMRKILLSKGDDYTNGDRLANFKLAGAAAGNSAEINCLNLIATKVARLGALLNSGKPPHHESVADSALDLTVYGILLNMLFEDKNQLYAVRTNDTHSTATLDTNPLAFR